MNSFLWKHLGKVWSLGTGWVLRPVCLPEQTHNCIRLCNTLLHVTCGSQRRISVGKHLIKGGKKIQKIGSSHRKSDLSSGSQCLLHSPGEEQQLLLGLGDHGGILTAGSLEKTGRCLTNNVRQISCRSGCGQGQERPSDKDWEDRPGLDKVLEGRTGTCQGRIRPSSQNRR